MKKILNILVIKRISYFLLSIICGLSMVTCDNFDDPRDFQITAEDNITTFLEKNSSEFSLFIEMLNRDITLQNGNTIKYGSFLNAYSGNFNGYTLFAPTNEAINAYLAKSGYSTVSEIPTATVEKLLQFHILTDTISTSAFTDGKLGVSTMYGQYLVVNSIFNNNSSKILVNKQANIIAKNISLGNGIVHIIDGLLEPSDSTLYQKIVANPEYSIFVDALKATKYEDSINIDAKNTGKWRTLFPVPNSVYDTLGIKSFSDLKNKYSNDGDSPENPTDSLNLYVRYHILNNLNFVADFRDGSTYSTLAGSKNPVSITTRTGKVIINEYVVNGDTTQGATIDRNKSDNSCNNGVIHVADKNYEIIIWHKARVFFDFADYPDIRSKVSFWGQSYATSLKLLNSDLAGIDMYSKATSTYESIIYIGNVIQPYTAKRLFVNFNNLEVNLRATRVLDWIKFTTPFIAAGTYKVWIAFATNGSASNDPNYVTIGTSETESTDMGNIVYFNSGLPNRGTRTLYDWDNYLYGLGLKRPSQLAGAIGYNKTANVSFYLGKVNILTSGKHWLKITPLTTGSSSSRVWIDYVEFIPEEDDQIWPKPDQNGTWYPRPQDNYDDAITPIY